MSYPVPSSAPFHPANREGEISFRRLWDGFRRDWWLVLTALLLMLGLAALVTFYQTRIYTSQTTIQIRDEQPSLGRLGDQLPISFGPLGTLRGGGIATDIGVLRSRSVAEAVVDSLGMTVHLLEPDSASGPVLRVLEASRELRPGVYELEREEGEAYTLRVTDGVGAPDLPRRIEIGRPFRMGAVTLALDPALRRNPPERIRFATLRFREAVEGLRQDLKVLRPDPSAQIVAVEYRTPVRYLAAEVPNAVAQSFIRYKGRTNDAESRNTVDFLQDQVANYQAQLASAEQRLESFREQAQIIAPAEQASGQVRQYIELQARRNELQTERESLERVLARIDNAAPGDSTDSPYLQLASFPAFLSNGAVQNILQTLTQFQSERSRLLVRRTPQNDEVQEITHRIGELELQLDQLARNYLRSIGNELASLDNTLARFANQLEVVPSREIEYNRLLRDQQLLEQVYTLLQTRLKEEEVKAAANPSDVRILDAALVPDGPTSPRPLLNFALAAVLGLVVGAGIVFVREIRDSKVRTPDDVADATWGMPILGVIPRPALYRTSSGNGREPSRRLPEARSPNGLVALDIRSPASEAYRSVRNRIAFTNPERAPQILVVTSAAAGDGKSTTAANLAVTLAQQGMRTLLVDADLRGGELYRLLDANREPGFAELVLGRGAPEEMVQQVSIGAPGVPLHFLAAGVLPPNPTEVIGLPTTRRVLKELRERYEAIVLDAPPLASSTDAALLGRIADATVLVTRLGATDREALEHAAAQLHEFGILMGGVILNDSRSPATENGWIRGTRAG